MADIWSGIGAEITQSEDDWLYRVDGEVRGPVSEAVLSHRIALGEVPLNTLAACDGGEYNPVLRIASFAKSVRIAQKEAARKRRKRIFVGISTATCVIAAAGSGAAYWIWQEAERKTHQAIAEAARRSEELAQKRAELEKVTAAPELVALVSLGSEDEVEIRQRTKRRRSRRNRRGVRRGAAPPAEESFSSCTRSQGSILSTLRKNLVKINVCVEDEKTRDAASLPNQMNLEFVVQTSGKVTDFRIEDRRYRIGPMKNCMTKVFRRVKYPPAAGSNCPVTIPIKIGN